MNDHDAAKTELAELFEPGEGPGAQPNEIEGEIGGLENGDHGKAGQKLLNLKVRFRTALLGDHHSAKSDEKNSLDESEGQGRD